LRSYIQRESESIQYFRTLVASLPLTGRVGTVLVETLKYRGSLSEERLMKAVGLFGNPRALYFIRKGLNAREPSTRAAALEALETLGDRRITNDVLPILESGGIFQNPEKQMGIAEVVNILISDEDRWLRALGAYVIYELRLIDFSSALRKMMFDPAVLVSDAARDAIAKMGGTVVMKTLKTLSAMDRIILLREVSLFSALSPEDLEKIAAVATEQIFTDQAMLCREGEPGNELFVIASGKVDVMKKIDSGERLLATYGTGDYVGEMAILESGPRSAGLKARGGVRVLAIEGSAFNAILLDRPEVAVSALRHMSKRVRELNEKIGASGS
jgi:hypothetical protein